MIPWMMSWIIQYGTTTYGLTAEITQLQTSKHTTTATIDYQNVNNFITEYNEQMMTWRIRNVQYDKTQVDNR